jgi:predicted transcriptional regulator
MDDLCRPISRRHKSSYSPHPVALAGMRRERAVVSVIMVSMARQSHIGQAELEVLQFIADRGKVTVRQAADHFGESKGYVRTTLLQMMERLRKKGFLKRTMVDGLYHYESVDETSTIYRSLIERFVEGSLGGSLAPFVAYLTAQGDVSDDELTQLKQLVDQLETKRKGKR